MTSLFISSRCELAHVGEDAVERRAHVYRARRLFRRDPKPAGGRRRHAARQVSCRGDPHRFASDMDASLRRKTAPDHASYPQWRAVVDTFLDRSRPGHAGQRHRDIPRTDCDVWAALALLPAILRGDGLGHNLGNTGRSRDGQQRNHRSRTEPAEFYAPAEASTIVFVAPHKTARGYEPSRENRPGYPRQA